MSLMEDRAEFLGELAGLAIEDQKASQKRQERQDKLKELMQDGLPQGQRDELRRAMSFSVERKDQKGKKGKEGKEGKEVHSMDKRGQRHSIETEDVHEKYNSISPEDYGKVQAALEKITEIKEKMLAAKDSEGKPLFEEDDLMAELYTPLVREGVMPENLVIDEHSETAKLLKQTYKSYTNMLEKERKKQQKKEAVQRINFHGASDWKDQIKGMAHVVKGVGRHKLGVLASKTNYTTDELQRIGAIGMKTAKAGALAFKIGKTGIRLDDTMAGVPPSNQTASPEKLAKQSAKVLTKGVIMGISIGVVAKEHLDTEKIGKKGNRNAVLELAATVAAWKIEDAIAEELKKLEPAADGALDGRIAKLVKPSAVRKGVVEEQFKLVAAALSEGFKPGLAGLTKVEPVKQALERAGDLLVVKFESAVDVKAFAAGLDFHVKPMHEVLDPFIAVARQAAAEAFTEAGLANAFRDAKSGESDPVGDDLKRAASENVKAEELQTDLQKAALGGALVIDETVADALLGAADDIRDDDLSLVRTYLTASQAVRSRIAKKLDDLEMADWAAEEPPNADALVQHIAGAAKAALEGLVQDSKTRQAFSDAGTLLADRFGTVADRQGFQKLVQQRRLSGESMAGVFDGFAEAAMAAAQEAFKSQAFRQAVRAAQQELLDAVAQNNEALTEELEAEQKKTDEFERKLVLLDESGSDMARQQSLAELIGQLEKDRLDLEIVNQVAGIFGSWGTSVVRLGTDSSNVNSGQVVGTVATEVAQSMVPAMKAAQLVMQMATNVIQIYRRAQLVTKFEQDVQKALKAKSPLLPAIENFFEAKTKQQFFAKAELALQAVQLAGAIVASVPEPITMATGRLVMAIGRFGSAVEGVGKAVYENDQLSKGWDLTLAALRNTKNRRAGLDALRMNSTLAVHAVAWAAMENDDPVAREILRSCGVNAQTLADSASDQKTVIEYLETRLHEDLEFKDGEKLDTNWIPNPLVLSYPAWFTILKRAGKRATPPLAESDTSEIAKSLRLVDLQPTVDQIKKGANGATTVQFQAWLGEAERLRSALLAYKPMGSTTAPKTEDQKEKDKKKGGGPTVAANAPHREMLQVRKRLLDLLQPRIDALSERLKQDKDEGVVEKEPELQDRN